LGFLPILAAYVIFGCGTTTTFCVEALLLIAFIAVAAVISFVEEAEEFIMLIL
jgi:hypothetical protein